MKWIFPVTLSVLGAFAQAPIVLPPVFTPTPQWFDLKQYLQLSDAQYVKLLDNQAQSQRMNNLNQQRIFQLQGEIAAETARDRPDPVELGSRYAEIEMICRQFSVDAEQLRDQNASLLTDTQKPRLKALEDAMKLAPIIAQAQSASLLDQFTFGFVTNAPSAITNTGTGTSVASLVIGGISTSPPFAGCQARFVPLPGPISSTP